LAISYGHAADRDVYLAPGVRYMGSGRTKMSAMPDGVVQSGLEPRIGRSVSLDHAADLLGVSRRTIYNRIRDGRLLTIRTLGGSQRVLLDSVQDQRSHAADMPFRSQAL
jgi:excisionase family DNA binding protein